MLRIPVGYQYIPVEELDIDDVVYTIGRVVDVFPSTREITHFDPIIGEIEDEEDIIVFAVESRVEEGEFLLYEWPVGEDIQVIVYSELLGLEDDTPLLPVKSKVVPIFSSKKKPM